MTKGIVAHNGSYHVSQGHFLSDNTFSGPTTWPRANGIEEYAGITVSGAGHVVCHNRFDALGDVVHGTGHGRPCPEYCALRGNMIRPHFPRARRVKRGCDRFGEDLPLPFSQTERLATAAPTLSASSVALIFRFADTTSKFMMIAMPVS